jgi:hypothetical protein
MAITVMGMIIIILCTVIMILFRDLSYKNEEINELYKTIKVKNIKN